MNNVSVKPKVLTLLIIGVLVFLVGLLLIKTNEKTDFYIIVIPLIFLYIMSNFVFYLNNADVTINETNDIITIKTIFNQKIILLKELKIIKYIPTKILAFLFSTNQKRIKLNYTQENYDIMVKILKLMNSNQLGIFINEIEKRSSWIPLDGGQWMG